MLNRVVIHIKKELIISIKPQIQFFLGIITK